MTTHYEDRVNRGNLTAKEVARRAGKSAPTAQRWTSRSREDWLVEMAREREAIRAYHDDEGHSWPETGRHFGLAEDTVKRRGYRARKQRATESPAQLQDALPVDKNLAS